MTQTTSPDVSDAYMHRIICRSDTTSCLDVLDQKTQEVRNFDINPDKNSDFFIANHLWDLIDPPVIA